jgi:DNA polymerase-4
MNSLGIHTGLDLRRQPRAFLAEHFGKAADYYDNVARGVDNRPVEADRERKSVGSETTFEQDHDKWEDVEPALNGIFAKVWSACTRGGHAGRTVTVKIKYRQAQFALLLEQAEASRSQARPELEREG